MRTTKRGMAVEDPTVDAAPMDRAAVTKGFAWTALFSLVAKVVFPLASLFLVARVLGPAITGIYALLQMTLQIAEVIRDAGLTQSYLAEKDVTPTKEASYGGLALISGLIPAVIVLLATPLMARFFVRPELTWALPFVSLCLLLTAIGTVPSARLLRKGDLKRQGSYILAASGLSLLVTIILVALGIGFPALVAQMVVNTVAYLALVLRVEPLPGLRVAPAEIKDLFRRTRALFGANLLNNLFLLSDVFVIQKLVGTVPVGLYNAAQSIAYKPADLITFPLSKTLQVAFSQSVGDIPRLARAYYRSLAAIVLFVVPIYVFLGLGADTIVLLLGPKFKGTGPVVSALCLYLACRTLGNISGNALVPAGKHAWTFYPWVLALVVTGAGVAWVSRSPSLMGVVWAYVAGAVAVYGMITALALYFIPGDKELFARVGRAGTMTAVTSLVLLGAFSLPVAQGWRFAIAAVAGIGAHLALIGTNYGIGAFGLLSRHGVREVWRRL